MMMLMEKPRLRRVALTITASTSGAFSQDPGAEVLRRLTVA
jgi:hypothetical protein